MDTRDALGSPVTPDVLRSPAAVRLGRRTTAVGPPLTRLLLVPAVIAACDPGHRPEAPAAQAFAVRDSGDVEIVENHAPELIPRT